MYISSLKWLIYWMCSYCIIINIIVKTDYVVFWNGNFIFHLFTSFIQCLANKIFHKFNISVECGWIYYVRKDALHLLIYWMLLHKNLFIFCSFLFYCLYIFYNQYLNIFFLWFIDVLDIYHSNSTILCL